MIDKLFFGRFVYRYRSQNNRKKYFIRDLFRYEKISIKIIFYFIFDYLKQRF